MARTKTIADHVTMGTTADTPTDTIERYAVARDGSEVVLATHTIDESTKTLHVRRTEYAYVYPHYDCRRGVDVSGHYRKTQDHTFEFDLIGSDNVVEHDGRTAKEYATERFHTLMSKRFPA